MIMYKACFPDILSIDVHKETRTTVFYMVRNTEMRESKVGRYWQWFSTWQEAKDHMVAQEQAIIMVAQRDINRATGRLERVNQLTVDKVISLTEQWKNKGSEELKL